MNAEVQVVKRMNAEVQVFIKKARGRRMNAEVQVVINRPEANA